MNHEPTYRYDADVDILYVSFAPGEKATAAVELTDNILLRFNRAERRAIGLTFMDFSVLVQRTEFGPRAFPLSGLTELSPDWQVIVAEILNQPPVNQLLKVFSYIAEPNTTIPMASVEKPPLLIAA